ncbi:MAG TPA: energy transducer TonB [Candidatus Acidoferrum sp.]|nr:energy transducer TonB [Candidatus Acidoferrum sp.]
MRVHRAIALLSVLLGFCGLGQANDPTSRVKNAVKKSTLDQPGTKPFHLKAVLAPMRDSERDSNRTGEVEIWWASPTQWKREIRSPEFHQVAIKNGVQEWQRNEGDYFPEWLREIAVALINPIPSFPEVLEQLKTAEVKDLMGSTYFSWMIMSTDGAVKKGLGAQVAVKDSNGLLFYGGGSGWGGLFEDYKSFHNRMVARTVKGGTPEVSAKVTILEDLPQVSPGFFDEQASGGDALLQTKVVEEIALRKNLLTTKPVAWPALQDGPLEGVLTTKIVVDRSGRVREVGTIVTDNPGVSEAARKAISTMQFRPYLENGASVQVVSRITMPFKTARPAGVETFESARTYFERGRRACFPAAESGPPYMLHAVFQARVKAGTVENGQYTDTWEQADEWRREAFLGDSRYVRAQQGERRYQLAEGPDAGLLRFVMRALEPIPAIDTFVESDWRMKRDTVEAVKTIRVLTGYESPEGELDAEHARGYWFDEGGKLIKTVFQGLETRRVDFQDFGGVQIARQIRVLKDGQLGMLINIDDVSHAGQVSPKTFELHGHEWKRAFTDEVR